MQTAFRMEGRGDVYVGTLKGWPGYGEVLAQVRQAAPVPCIWCPFCWRRAAMRSMTWRAKTAELESAAAAGGFSVRCTMAGFGLLPGVQQMYAEHLREGLQEEGGGVNGRNKAGHRAVPCVLGRWKGQDHRGHGPCTARLGQRAARDSGAVLKDGQSGELAPLRRLGRKVSPARRA